ncbi:MAG: alpha-ketoglutarate-dependent dioxygenase AlkB [Rhodospirillales bacterium]|nr:alpha-ketoglutarate-dependent dioxygenase AlkB [Rhodospirillales bacterium]
MSAERLLCGPDEIAAALARLAAEEAVSLPLLGPEACATLVAAAEALSYRQARPVVGEGDRRVLQDFEICMNPAAETPFHGLAKALEGLIARGLARLDPPPLPTPPPLNDLVVQRYPVGSRGITPHRDHLRYRDLVALVNLAGRARFFICPDRSGREAREIPLPPGSVLLMRAPGFAGRSDRPFHMLSEVTETRISLGLRHDVQREQP